MNRLCALRLSSLVLLVALLGASCGSSADDNTVVASFGDSEMTQGQLNDLLPDGDNTVPERVAQIVTTWLTGRAVERELLERGYPVSSEDLDNAKTLIGEQDADNNDTEYANLLEAFALSYTVNRWSENEITGLDELDPPNYLCSNHLLVETEEEAQAALDRYNAGEAFADLAIELSTGPSGPSGGDLGCTSEGSFVAEFEAVAYAGSAGDVVGPVQTDFGWHLIEIESVGPATVENHPNADPMDLAKALSDQRSGVVNTAILDLEAQAVANYHGEAYVDPSIGRFEEGTLDIIYSD